MTRTTVPSADLRPGDMLISHHEGRANCDTVQHVELENWGVNVLARVDICRTSFADDTSGVTSEETFFLVPAGASLEAERPGDGSTCDARPHLSPTDPEYLNIVWTDDAGWGVSLDVCAGCGEAIRLRA